MALAILSAIGAGLQLALLIAQHLFSRYDEKKEEVNKVFKEGIDAVKKLDATGYNLAIQHLRRMRQR
jgi:hypothetical protein